jgi:DNA-binding MarR family transcriptional regulator
MLSKKLLESIPKSIRVIRKLSTESLAGALTLQQIRVLNRINAGEGQTEMADNLQVSLAAISKMVGGLTRKKFIQSKTGTDRRTHIHTLTPKGKQTLDKITKYITAKLDIGIADLTKEEKDQLLNGLIILDRLMNKVKEV